jgi:hypothetical protein
MVSKACCSERSAFLVPIFAVAYTIAWLTDGFNASHFTRISITRLTVKMHFHHRGRLNQP